MAKLRIGLCFVLWVVLPTALFTPSDTIPFPTLAAALFHLDLFLWVFAAAAFLKRGSRPSLGLYALAAVVGPYFTLTYLLMAYSLYTGHALDARFLLDSSSELPTALGHALGPLLLLLLLGSSGTLAFGLTRLAHRATAGHEWRLRARPGFVLAVLSVGVAGLFPGSVSYVGQSLANAVASRRYGGDAHPIAETFTVASAAGSDENVFFVQLESVNALAAFAQGDRNVPQLAEMAKRGVLFPLAWGNTIQTARAMESVLCGLTNNVGPPLTFQPQAIATPCLSELLRQKGFTNVFAGGSADPDFHNIAGFLRAKGFDAVLGPELMEGGRHSYWGFDECEFFERALTHLEQQHPTPRRLFAWLAVSRHHYPFEDGNLDADRPFARPQSFVERYLNSLHHQDACLGALWKRLSDYAGASSHVFVFGDHSWPVGISGTGNTHNEHGSHVENFAVPILYVPPRARAAEFAVGTRPDVRVGQTDLAATVLELLGVGSGASSFASILRGERASRYEECQVLVQPYSDAAIVAVRHDQKHTYHLASGQVTRTGLSAALVEGPGEVVAEQLAYARFAAEYGCARHRTTRGPT